MESRNVNAFRLMQQHGAKVVFYQKRDSLGGHYAAAAPNISLATYGKVAFNYLQQGDSCSRRDHSMCCAQ